MVDGYSQAPQRRSFRSMAHMEAVAQYRAGLRELRARAPELPLHRLLLRVLAWKACRIAHLSPVIRLHGRSRMRLDAKLHDHGINSAIFLYHEAYEPSVRCAIDRFVRPAETCYDIGANFGLWSLRMAERAGEAGHVFAFEPIPECFRALAENAKLSGLHNIDVLPCALAASSGPSTIFMPSDLGRSALARESADDVAIQVAVRTLDDVWDSQGQPPVSFVKMDVEGAEPLVLRGGQRFFATLRPVVCCEINPGKLQAMNFSSDDVLNVFASLGYKGLAWSEHSRDLVPYVAQAKPDDILDLVFIPDEVR